MSKKVMSKKLVLFLLLFMFQIINAQVGVNVKEPKATMEIKHIDNTVACGILLPKITGDELKAMDHLYGQDQDGALVHVTQAVASPDLGGKTYKISIPGIYYYSHASESWENMNPPKTIENRTYVMINKDAAEEVSFSNPKNIRWGTIEGLNYSNIQLASNQTQVVLPKGYIFKVTGMIGVGSGGTPTYIITNYEATPSNKMVLSTKGFSESSTEIYEDGGVTNPIAIVDTSEGAVTLSLKAYGPGNNRKTVVAGASTNYSIGTYLIIEQLL